MIKCNLINLQNFLEFKKKRGKNPSFLVLDTFITQI